MVFLSALQSYKAKNSYGHPKGLKTRNLLFGVFQHLFTAKTQHFKVEKPIVSFHIKKITYICKK